MFQFTNDNQGGPDTPYASVNPQLTPGTITAVAWSEDGQYVAVGDAHGNIRFLSDIVCSCFDQMSEFQAHPQQINAISWASNSLKFATASNDGTVQTWNVVIKNQTNAWADVTAQHLQTFTASAPVQTVAWSPNGQQILYGDSAGNVGFWQVQ
jgi:WD40 repeat protein